MSNDTRERWPDYMTMREEMLALRAEVSRLTGEHKTAMNAQGQDIGNLLREIQGLNQACDAANEAKEIWIASAGRERDAALAEVERLTGERDEASRALDLERTEHRRAYDAIWSEHDAALARVAELRGGLGEIKDWFQTAFADCHDPEGEDEGAQMLVEQIGALLASTAPEAKTHTEIVEELGLDETLAPVDEPAPSVGMVTREEHEKEIADKVQDAMRNEAELHDRLVSTLADNAALREHVLGIARNYHMHCDDQLHRPQQRAFGACDHIMCLKARAFAAEPHPGAALLEEVERLRKGFAKAQELGWDNPASLIEAARKAKAATKHTGESCRALHLTDDQYESAGCPLCCVASLLTEALKDGGGK